MHIFAFRIVCKFQESMSMNVSMLAQNSSFLSNMVVRHNFGLVWKAVLRDHQ